MKAGILLGLEKSWREHWHDVNWSRSNVEPHSGTALCVCCCLLYHTLRATVMPDSLWWTINDKEHVKSWLHLLLVTFFFFLWGVKDFDLMVIHLRQERVFSCPWGNESVPVSKNVSTLPFSVVFHGHGRHFWALNVFFPLMLSVYYFNALICQWKISS